MFRSMVIAAGVLFAAAFGLTLQLAEAQQSTISSALPQSPTFQGVTSTATGASFIARRSGNTPYIEWQDLAGLALGYIQANDSTNLLQIFNSQSGGHINLATSGGGSVQANGVALPATYAVNVTAGVFGGAGSSISYASASASGWTVSNQDGGGGHTIYRLTHNLGTASYAASCTGRGAASTVRVLNVDPTTNSLDVTQRTTAGGISSLNFSCVIVR